MSISFQWTACTYRAWFSKDGWAYSVKIQILDPVFLFSPEDMQVKSLQGISLTLKLKYLTKPIHKVERLITQNYSIIIYHTKEGKSGGRKELLMDWKNNLLEQVGNVTILFLSCATNLL